jgi:hypothetical protein
MNVGSRGPICLKLHLYVFMYIHMYVHMYMCVLIYELLLNEHPRLEDKKKC